MLQSFAFGVVKDAIEQRRGSKDRGFRRCGGKVDMRWDWSWSQLASVLMG